MYIICFLTFIGLVNQPVEVQEIRNDIDAIFNLELSLPEIELRACEYGKEIESEQLPMLDTLALQELEMGMRNQNLNLIKVGLMLRAYVCGMFQCNPEALHQRVIQAFDSSEKFYAESTIPSATESIDEMELDKHFTFAHIITREYLIMAYQGKEYSKCLDAALSALSSHDVYIRSIAIKNIRRMICGEKYENVDFSKLKNLFLELKTREKDLKHYTSMDEIMYKHQKKSIEEGIEDVLNYLRDKSR